MISSRLRGNPLLILNDFNWFVRSLRMRLQAEGPLRRNFVLTCWTTSYAAWGGKAHVKSESRADTRGWRSSLISCDSYEIRLLLNGSLNTNWVPSSATSSKTITSLCSPSGNLQRTKTSSNLIRTCSGKSFLLWDRRRIKTWNSKSWRNWSNTPACPQNRPYQETTAREEFQEAIW